MEQDQTDRLKKLSWLLAGLYVAGLTAWSILDPLGFQDSEGLILLAGLPLGLFVIALTVKKETG